MASSLRPNLLYSRSGLTTAECSIVQVALSFFEKKCGTRDSANQILVVFSSASLECSVTCSPPSSIIRVDFELQRLTSLVIGFLEDFLYDKGLDSKRMDELANRLIFHSAIRSGEQWIIPGIPVQPRLRRFLDEEDPLDAAALGMFFCLAHESKHIRLDPSFGRRGEAPASFSDFSDQDTQFSYRDMHLDLLEVYESMFEKRIAARPFKKPDESLLDEIRCDLNGIILTFLSGIEANFHSGTTLGALFGASIIQVMLEFTSVTLASKAWEAEVPSVPNLERISALCEREKAFQNALFVFVSYLSRDCVRKDKEKSLESLSRMIAAKNEFLARFVDSLWVNLKRSAANTGSEPFQSNIRALIDEWGYHSSRISTMLLLPTETFQHFRSLIPESSAGAPHPAGEPTRLRNPNP